MLIFAFSLAALFAADLTQVELWKQGDGGVHTYRIPALIETKNGTLLAVADARHDSSKDLPARISLVMRRSKDRGRTWSPQVTIHKVEQGGAGDASLLLDKRTGRVWCFFAYGPPGIGFPTTKPGATTGPTTLQWHAIHSDDDGLTWSAPTDLTPQVKDPAWHGFFPTSGMHIETSKGRFIVPLVIREADAKSVVARNAYSDDRGQTWKLAPSFGPGTDESHAVEWVDGTIVQNMRSGPRRAVARSTDGGSTFSATTHDDALIDPVCNAGIARYVHKNRKFLIFTNAASSKRERLTVKLSADGGLTWPYERVLHAGPAAYSTVLMLRDGTVGVLYERGEKFAAEKITFARFPVDWVITAKN